MTSLTSFLTSLVCRSFPSHLVAMCLPLLMIICNPNALEELCFFSPPPPEIPALIDFSVAAARDHRRHPLRPTAHIAQVSIGAVISCADKPTPRCQSAACNEQRCREGKQSVGSYSSTTLFPARTVYEELTEPAELTRKTITSQVCPDDPVSSAAVCGEISV